MDRWLYFKYRRSPKPENVKWEQVKGESPLGHAKPITHNSWLIGGYSWAFWIRPPRCIKSMCWDLLDILQVTKRKKRSLCSLWGGFYALQLTHQIFTAYSLKPHESPLKLRWKWSGVIIAKAASSKMTLSSDAKAGAAVMGPMQCCRPRGHRTRVGFYLCSLYNLI